MILFCFLSLISISVEAKNFDFSTPQYLWAETVNSAEVNKFTAEQNANTEDVLRKNPDFTRLQDYFKKNINLNQELSKTKALIRGKYAYNYFADDQHPHGLYRRVNKDDYRIAKELKDFSKLKWETIIDIDSSIKTIKFPQELSDPSPGRWVCKFDDLIKDRSRCLIGFNQSGGDRNIYYEFDIQEKKWITQNNFNFEILGRSSFSWIDEDTLIVGLDGLAYHNALNPNAPISQEQAISQGLLTPTGYPSRFYIWKRGESFSTKNLIYQAGPDKRSVGISSGIKLTKDFDNKKILFLYESVDSRNWEIIMMHDMLDTGRYARTQVPLPKKQDILGISHSSEIVFKTDMDWQGFKKDDILSIKFEFAGNELTFSKPKLIYRLQDPEALLKEGYFSVNEDFDSTDDQIFITLSKNVSESIVLLDRSGDSWTAKKFNDPLNLKYKSISMWVDDNDKTLHLSVSNFLTPQTEYIVRNEDGKYRFEMIDKELSDFDSSKFSIEQLWIDQGLDQNGKSTKVPYYIIYDPNKIKLNENTHPAPTLMYGYGGFSISMMPAYLGTTGHAWLEKGGVYVMTNIRGGNEFGSYWHESALKENRINSYNDFIGIAEDLIKRGITTPQKLAIQGGSNGGLLVGVAMTLRPDLFKAVVCEVPLLDMSRYHKLLVGSSWMDEYGNPETSEKSFWSKYSPLHSLREGVSYPTVFLKTNRNDDRVHPAHARKFSLRLNELGIKHLYYEDLKGGHGGTSMTSDEYAFRNTLEYVFLYDQMGMSF